MHEIRINKDAKDMLLNSIIDIEWRMFDKVHNEGCRASCQDDFRTFYIMRYSQFRCFSKRMLESYLQDLKDAENEGRNMLTEKYGYMMEYTDPEYFKAKLLTALPQITEEKKAIVKGLTDILLGFEEEFRNMYPRFSGKIRPVSGDGKYDVSFKVYTIGELETYSLRTLALYALDLNAFRENGENPSVLIHEKTAEFYGYENLRKAEESIR